MDPTVLIPSVTLGLVLVMLHVFRCYKSGVETNIGVVVNAFLQASGIICGFFLMVGSVYAPAKAYLKGIDIYIFIAGVTVLFVSAKGIRKEIFTSNEKK